MLQSIEFWKIVFLFLAVWFTLLNTMRFIGRQTVFWLYLIIQAIGITGFIYLQWLVE